jgi:hypothetical protein
LQRLAFVVGQDQQRLWSPSFSHAREPITITKRTNNSGH